MISTSSSSSGSSAVFISVITLRIVSCGPATPTREHRLHSRLSSIAPCSQTASEESIEKPRETKRARRGDEDHETRSTTARDWHAALPGADAAGSIRSPDGLFVVRQYSSRVEDKRPGHLRHRHWSPAHGYV